MDILTTLTSQLKESLINVSDDRSKEKLIFEHIKNLESFDYIVDDFPSGLDWFNTSKPLCSSLLKGKIVVLDFFTYCCINCLHIIPHLRHLEENFSVPDGLIVIGVHSAKFDNEKESENILQALKRYNISHPVVNDRDCYLWNKLNISCWPTVLILGPDRQPLFVLVGEGHKDELLLFVKTSLKYYKNSISSHHLPLVNCSQIITSSLLSFPGKISRWKNRLAVSDSGNHRILVFNDEGNIQFRVGGKAPGFKDGTLESARFNSPQGLAFLDYNTFYVADTENHAIRVVDLSGLTVKTVAGNGRQGADTVGGGEGSVQEISSPWDVCIVPCSDVDIPSLGIPVPAFSKYGVKNDSVPPPVPPPSLIPPPPPPSVITSPPPPSVITSPPPPPPPPPRSIISPPSLGNSCACPPPPRFDSFSSMPNQNKNVSTSKVLLIAAAGTHQIWAYFLDDAVWWKGIKYNKNTCVAIAGTGREENRNNRYPLMASFAQPSGLAYSKELKCVFIADSESSSIRKLNLIDGSVSHVVGGARSPDDLFSYGDKDGKTYEAKLQHPLGVAWNSKQKLLYVCDSYNHKVKKIDPSDNSCLSLHTESNLFSEPSGCCFNESEDVLFVCDTNNNGIKTIDTANGSMKKFDLKEPLSSKDEPLKEWKTETSINKSGGSLTLRVEFSPPDTHGKWKLVVGKSKMKADKMQGKMDTNVLELVIDVGSSAVDDSFQVLFDLMLCENNSCSYRKIALQVSLRRRDEGDKAVICKVNKNLL